jgi:hypothetical protein
VRSFGGQQLATARDARPAGAVGEEPVVADADEAVGEDVEEEAAEELVDRYLQDLDPISVGVVAVAQRNLVSFDA